MTILTALQGAAVRLVGYRPSSIFSSTDQIEIELADLANEVAVDIMKSHPWRALTKFATVNGDGVTTEFPMPADYDRMVTGQSVQDAATWFWGYTPAPDLDTWMTITDGRFLAVSPGWWIILGGAMQFYPAPATGAVARYPYVSNRIVIGTDDAMQRRFTGDTDRFVLPERLITLGVLWRYREQKGMGYAEDMANYEMALSQEQARDKGSRVIRRGAATGLDNVGYAWPWQLG